MQLLLHPIYFIFLPKCFKKTKYYKIGVEYCVNTFWMFYETSRIFLVLKTYVILYTVKITHWTVNVIKIGWKGKITWLKRNDTIRRALRRLREISVAGGLRGTAVMHRFNSTRLLSARCSTDVIACNRPVAHLTQFVITLFFIYERNIAPANHSEYRSSAEGRFHVIITFSKFLFDNTWINYVKIIKCIITNYWY